MDESRVPRGTHPGHHEFNLPAIGDKHFLTNALLNK
jgi:hypothetical protein